MTENTTQDAPQAPVTPVDPWEQAKQATVAILNQLITEANDAARVVKSAANQKAVIADVIETSDDEQVAAYRENVEKAEAALLKWEEQITEYVKANLLPKGEENNVEAATATYKEKAAAIKGFVGTMKTLNGGEEALKDLPQLSSLGRGSGSQTGVKRPRISELYIKPATAAATEYNEVFAEQKNPKTQEIRRVSNFSVLAQKLKGAPYNLNLTARDILEHAEGVAGPAESWADRDGNPFTFVISPENGEHVEVKVVP